MARYYIEMEGYRYGPFELQELKQLNQDGVLKGDQIYEEQSNQLFSLTRLLAEFQTAQPMSEPIPQVQAFASYETSGGLPETPTVPEAAAAEEAPAAKEAPAAEEASAVPEAREPAPSESWSERLSRLKAANSTTTDLGAAAPEPSKPDSIMDAATNELMEEMVADLDDLPSAAKSTDELPDLLVTSGPHPEELINYSTAIKDDIRDQEPSINLKAIGGDAKTATGDANAGSFPTTLGYMKDALDLEPPTEWLANGVGSTSVAGSANTAGPAKEVKLPEPFSVFAGGRGNAPAPVDSALAAPELSAAPVALTAPTAPQEQESNAPLAQSQTPAQALQPKERSANEASAWREQMARLDVVYGVRESIASKDLQSLGQDNSADAASLKLSGASDASEIDGGHDDSEDEPQEKSGPKLGSLVFITAGLVVLLARTNYMALTEMPGLIVTAVLCGYAVLTAICGVVLWIDAGRFKSVLSIVLLCLLLCPLAMLGYTLFVYKDSVMAMQISKALQLPLAYMAASLIMHALGLAILKKAPETAENN